MKRKFCKFLFLAILCDNEKTRYIYLDTGYKANDIKQVEFLKKTLLETPDNWHIVVVTHVIFDNNYGTSVTIGGVNKNTQVYLDILDDYNSRTREFALCNARVEFCIGGHNHRDFDGYTNGGIPLIVTESDCFNDRSGLDSKKGTTNESAISAIIVDFDKRKIHVIRVLRGADRIIEY